MKERNLWRPVGVKLLGGVAAIVVWAIWLRVDRSPADEQAARTLVERGYLAAQGGEADNSLTQVWLLMMQKRYGRVLHYRITGTRWSWRPHVYAFALEVQRENGKTHEIAEVLSGWSKRGNVLAMDRIQVEDSSGSP